jgi:membrane protein required for beta-lactamase induction
MREVASALAAAYPLVMAIVAASDEVMADDDLATAGVPRREARMAVEQKVRPPCMATRETLEAMMEDDKVDMVKKMLLCLLACLAWLELVQSVDCS